MVQLMKFALDIVAIDGIIIATMLFVVGVDVVGIVDNDGAIIITMLP